jgi:PAS domain S-box-containing protein
MRSRQVQDIYAETLAVFDRGEHRYEPLTTPEVADALDVGRRTVYNRLRKLVERGTLETKETGANSRVWWRPPGDPSTAASAGGDTEGSAGAGGSSSGGTEPEAGTAEEGTPRSAERRRTDADYRETLETIPDGVTLHDPTDGTLVDATQQFCGMLGYTRAELLAVDFDTIHADAASSTGEEAKQRIQQAVTDGPRTVEWLLETSDGDRLPVEVRLRRATIDGNDRVVAVVREVPARTERERELRESNQRLRAALDAVEGVNFIKSTDGQYQHMNDECKDLLGLDTDADVVGLTDEDLFPEAVAEQYRADDRRVLEEGEPIEHEEDVPTPRGSRTHLTTKSPLFDAEGEPIGVFGVTVDITERRKRKRELRARSMAMEASIDGMAILDPNGEYTFVNQAHADIYGYDDPDAFLGESWRMCYDEDGLARFEDDTMPTLREEGSWRGETTGKRKNGTTFPQELSLTTTDGGGIICVVRDITERRERERELRETSRRLSLALETTDTGVWEWNMETDEVIWNETLERLLGLEPGSFDGTYEASAEYIHPDDAPKIEQSIEDALDGDGTFRAELRMHREDGERIWVAGRGELLTENGPRRIVGTATDITDRKESERALARRELLDPSVELEFHSDDLARTALQRAGCDLAFTLDGVVPQSDGTQRLYGTAKGPTAKEFQDVLDAVPVIEETRLLSTVGDTTRYELSAEPGSVAGVFASFDGELQSIVTENDTCKLVGEFPETVDPEAVLRAVREPYPDIDLASQRRIVSPAYLRSTIEDRLTERQRTVLGMAYHAEYFEQPRGSTGDELADRLGITRQTFHAHLRKAQSTVFHVVFEETVELPG